MTEGTPRSPRQRVAVIRHSSYPEDMHVRRDALALRDAGFRVDLICDYHPGRPRVEKVDGITVFRIPPRHRRGGIGRYLLEYTLFPVIAAVVLALLSLRSRYKWVEINNMPDWLMIAALVPRMLGSRVAFYSREDMARLMALDHDLPMTHPVVRLLSFLGRLSCQIADAIIVTQEFAVQDLVRQGIPAHKLVAIPNAPDEAAFLARVPELRKVRAPENTEEGRFRLVTHGLLMKRYGIETLLHAMVLLRRQIPRIELEIIGEGEYRPVLEDIVRELHLESHVTFTGFVPEYEDVAPRLLQADLGVVPIWSNHQLCNKLVDYLALGMPAVTTESAALRPYLDDTEVRYVEPRSAQALADAIMDLYLHPELRVTLGSAGRQAYLQHFGWEQARSSYLAVYQAEDREDRQELARESKDGSSQASAGSQEKTASGGVYV